MSIATAIQAAQQKIANAYAAISNKGGTLPATQDLSNMPTAINSIQTGITPTGTKYITSNGTYNVTNYEYANVDVSGGGTTNPFGILFTGEIDAQGNYTMPYDLTYTGNISFDGIKNIPTGSTNKGGMFASYLYHQSGASNAGRLKCRLITGTVTFPDLETVYNESCFSSFCNEQRNITSISFPKLTTISGTSAFAYAFQKCASLTTISFPNLTTMSASQIFSSAFSYCTSLTTVSFPSLTTMSAASFNNAFQYCTSLTTVSFPSLTTAPSNFGSNAFQYCTSLKNIYFNSLTTNITSNNALSGVTGCTVHLPTGYTGTCNLSGGTNTVYLYDL